MEPDAAALMPITPATAGAPTVTLAAVAVVQRLDVAAMREKALGILASLKAQAAIAKKHGVSFFENIVHSNPSNNQQMKGNCICCSTLVTSTGSSRVPFTQREDGIYIACVLAFNSHSVYSNPFRGSAPSPEPDAPRPQVTPRLRSEPRA